MKLSNAILNIITVILGIFQLISCAPTVAPYIKTALGIEKIFERNYEVGRSKKSYVGEPMVKVKDYTLHRYTSDIMHASNDFTIKFGDMYYTGAKNTDYKIYGKTNIEGMTLKCINIVRNNMLDMMTDNLIFIKDDGSIYPKTTSKKVSGTIWSIMVSIQVEPPDLKFTEINQEEMDIQKGYTNYELIYNGTDGKSISMTYREFTPDDLAKPAFYQNLIYQADAKQIRFKYILIQLEQVSNEKIVFSVVSDGLTH